MRHINLTSGTILGTLLFLMTGCAGGSYYVSHDSGAYAEADSESWCDEHQVAHHDDEFTHGDVVVEVDEPYYEVEVEHHHDTTHDGYTACGDFFAPDGVSQNSCHPGQYCKDSTFSKCATGCLSDVNCAGHEVCIKGRFSNVGSCQAAGSYSMR